jgi:CheY-like chemotaxis protein
MENRTTVLYVDDNPKSSRLLTSVLEECGFRVITKNDPVEALTLCKRTYFDLALLDYEMPLMSGSTLAHEIKYLVPDVPVVLISGRSAMPASELAFVDAHFGFGTSLDDLLWTMRILAKPIVFVPERDQRGHEPVRGPIRGNRLFQTFGSPLIEPSRWADST